MRWLNYIMCSGAHVPDSFEQFDELIGSVYTKLVADGVIAKREEPPVPSIPMDFSWAQKLGLIRKPTSFMSSISGNVPPLCVIFLLIHCICR